MKNEINIHVILKAMLAGTKICINNKFGNPHIGIVQSIQKNKGKLFVNILCNDNPNVVPLVSHVEFVSAKNDLMEFALNFLIANLDDVNDGREEGGLPIITEDEINCLRD